MKTQRTYVKTPDTQFTARSSIRPHTADIVQQQIKTKINTFMRWDANAYMKTKLNSKQKKEQNTQNNEKNDLFQALLKYAADAKKKQKLQKNRKKQVKKTEVVMQNYREKFKRIKNPLQIFNFYNNKQKNQPHKHEKIIINKFLQISALIETMQGTINLQRILDEIYKLMNIAVDFNEQKLLVLTIILTADICFQAKELKKAVFFYNQARLASIYSGLYQITIQSLVGLSKIAMELVMTGTAIIFLKKALAYTWNIKDTHVQIQIYDILGQTYCLQGKMQQANYYHERFSQNQLQKQQSVIRKIYLQIIKDDIKNKNLRLYTQNIDLLFLQSLNLPIYPFNVLPPFQTNNQKFENYIDGLSPRKELKSTRFKDLLIQDGYVQLKNILQQNQFRKQMPNPDLQTNFVHVQSRKYSKSKRQVDFSRTLQFHEILGKKIQVSQPTVSKRYSLQKQIQLTLAQKQDPNWYDKIKKYVRYQRIQKLGSMRDPIRKSHLKVHQRKRSLSNNSQKFKMSVNKAILSWVDPHQQ